MITQLEPGLFKKVTGLNVKDFELLVSLGVFNGALMNDAVYKFKRYEDSSLSYTGINKHEGENVGGYDTVLTSEEYNKLFAVQQGSMKSSTPIYDDLPEVGAYMDDDENDEDQEQIEVSVVEKIDLRPGAKQESSTTHQNRSFESSRDPVTSKSSEQSKPEINISGINRGTSLTHKTFGKGTVVKLDNDKIVVSFGKAEKMFMFPDALLNGFLKIE